MDFCSATFFVGLLAQVVRTVCVRRPEALRLLRWVILGLFLRGDYFNNSACSLVRLHSALGIGNARRGYLKFFHQLSGRVK